jgi:hypothetical protein
MEMVYFFLTIACAWFIVGTFFLAFAIMARGAFDDGED